MPSRGKGSVLTSSIVGTSEYKEKIEKMNGTEPWIGGLKRSNEIIFCESLINYLFLILYLTFRILIMLEYLLSIKLFTIN